LTDSLKVVQVEDVERGLDYPYQQQHLHPVTCSRKDDVRFVAESDPDRSNAAKTGYRALEKQEAK
jgi:hypothetical protein